MRAKQVARRGRPRAPAITTTAPEIESPPTAAAPQIQTRKRGRPPPSRRSSRNGTPEPSACNQEEDAEQATVEPEASPSDDEDSTPEAPKFLSNYEVMARAGKNSLRTLIPARLFDWDTIEVLGVNSRIRTLFSNIGWENFLEINQPVHRDLVVEFMSSVQFLPHLELSDSNAILFTMKGGKFNLSVNTLNVLLGFETDESLLSEAYFSAMCDIPDELKSTFVEQWKNMSVESFYAKGCSKSANIVDDGLRLCHRFLAHNLFGRTDSMNVVTQQEVGILDNMLSCVKMNFGYWIANQWRLNSTRFRGKISLGALVTLLAKKLGVEFDESQLLPSSTFGVVDFLNMGLVFVNDSGAYQLLKPGVKGPSRSSFAGNPGASSSAVPATDSTPPWALQLIKEVKALGERITTLEDTVRPLLPPLDPS